MLLTVAALVPVVTISETELEAQFRLNSPALIILSDKTIEGLVRYNSERRSWYEFTVLTPYSSPA